jgi:hypothetical protein
MTSKEILIVNAHSSLSCVPSAFLRSHPYDELSSVQKVQKLSESPLKDVQIAIGEPSCGGKRDGSVSWGSCLGLQFGKSRFRNS